MTSSILKQKTRARRRFQPAPLVAALAMAALGVGCSHAMRVQNLDAYAKSVSAPKPLTIQVVDGGSTPEERELVGFVLESLATHPSVGKAAMAPHIPDGFEPDAVVMVAPKTDYSGSWVNLPITFPGFLVFAHAWNGFVYEADVKTSLALSGPGIAGEVRDDIDTKFDLRYCDSDRGMATSSGWYTPFWGGLNLLIGVYNISYDDDASPEFRNEVRSTYGRYVANSIVELAGSHAQVAASRPGPRALEAMPPG